MAAPAPTYSLTQKLIWFTNPPILFLCAFFLYRRTDFRSFLGFFCYLLFVAATTIATYFVYGHWGYSSYPSFYVGWITNIVSIGISFYVLYEVVRNVLTSGTLKLSRSNIVLLTSTLLMLAALISLTFQAKNDVLLSKILFISENLARFEQIGLLITLAILTLFFGFYWGDLAFGVAVGFGFYAFMQLVGIYGRGRLGPMANHAYNLTSAWSYQIASLIWLFYIWKKPKPPLKALPSDKVSEYTEAIERLIKK